MAAAVMLEPKALPGLAPDDEPLYEILDGVRVELPPMSTLSSLVASEIQTSLGAYGRNQKNGRAAVEMLIRLPGPRVRNRRTDVMFVSYERWPADRPIPATGNAWDVVPDLAVEVISPTDLADEVMEKVAEYLAAGVRLVWVIYPRLQIIHIFDAAGQIRKLAHADVLDGGNVLPGFRQLIAELFPPVEPSAVNGPAS